MAECKKRLKLIKKVEGYTLELTEEEARALEELVGSYKYSQVGQRIYAALRKAVEEPIV